MSTRRLVVWITFLAIFAMSARISMDTDTWWHLRAGQWIVENNRLPRTDPFSHTRAGTTWEYPGWLVEVPMYWIYQAMGPGGLNLLTASIVTLAFGFVWGTMKGGEFLKAFVIILAATASGVYWAARPYMLTFLFSAIFLWILERYRGRAGDARKFSIWLLPVLMIFWANSHGGFIIGFVLWGVYWVSETGSNILRRSNQQSIGNHYSKYWTPLLTSGLLMVVAVCINPYGVSLLLYPFKTISIGVLREYIQEWQTPQFQSLPVQPFGWLLVLTFGSVGVSRKRLAFVDFALISIFAYLGLLAGRNIALFSIVAPMVITCHLAPVLVLATKRIGARYGKSQEPVKIANVVNYLILLVLVLLVFFKLSLIFPRSVNDEAFQKMLPVDAVNYLKTEKPVGRIFNSYNWGGYLIWALPEYPVFVDGRTDLYDDVMISEWVAIMRGEEGWQALLDRYQVGIVLIENGTTLDRYLKTDAGWEQAYADQQAVIYTKSQ